MYLDPALDSSWHAVLYATETAAEAGPQNAFLSIERTKARFKAAKDIRTKNDW